MNRSVRLIFNPHAYRGRAWATAASLQAVVREHPQAEWAATDYPAHATELAEQAGREGVSVVAALGGDGTVHEVANGLMRVPAERRPALAIVPIGSGNDFSTAVGIAPDPLEAARRVFSGSPHAFDIGRAVADGGRTEFFTNAVGIGFDAFVTYYSYRITRLQGFSMYLWAVIQTIIRNHDAPRMRISADQQSFEQEILMLTLCNGHREGGGFLVAPDARPNDGSLDYAMIRKVSRPMMFRLIPEVMKGTHGRFDAVQLGAFRHLEVQSERPLTIHMDGEMFAGFPSSVQNLTVDVLPGELQIIT